MDSMGQRMALPQARSARHNRAGWRRADVRVHRRFEHGVEGGTGQGRDNQIIEAVIGHCHRQL
jgi:hypothetical protein